MFLLTISLFIYQTLSALLFGLRLVYASLNRSVTLTFVCLVEISAFSLCLEKQRHTHTQTQNIVFIFERTGQYCKWLAAAKSLVFMSLTVRWLISHIQSSGNLYTPTAVIWSSLLNMYWSRRSHPNSRLKTSQAIFQKHQDSQLYAHVHQLFPGTKLEIKTSLLIFFLH